MKNFIVRSHKPGTAYKSTHLFILNKGLNSGKPLHEACPNCFVIIFEAEVDKESYYWLAYSLWKSKFWHQYLVGSVIPFLRIGDFTNQFDPRTRAMMAEHEEHVKNIKTLKLLQAKETQFHENINLINDLRLTIIYRYCKK